MNNELWPVVAIGPPCTRLVGGVLGCDNIPAQVAFNCANVAITLANVKLIFGGDVMPIRVECPHCGKGIKAPSKFAGKNAKCPACQKIFKVPAPEAAMKVERVAAAAPPAPPTPAPEPQAPPKVDSARSETSEHDLLKVSPAPFRNRPVACVLTGVLFLVLVLFAVATSAEQPWTWAGPILVAFIPGIWFLDSMTTSLTITNKRSILRRGILSKRTREVRHSDVRLLQVDQSLFQRILGVGTISLASAGHGEVEIMVNGLKKPQHVKETIDGYRP